MTFTAVHISYESAEELIDNFRAATGHVGELKGSRINLAKRRKFFDLLERSDASAEVGIIKSGDVSAKIDVHYNSDIKAYNHLLHEVIDHLLPQTGGCVNVVIDEGRYDPKILEAARKDIADMLGNWGKATMIDSKRSTGVQIADVIANSCYNIVTGSSKAAQIGKFMIPMLESKRINIEFYELN